VSGRRKADETVKRAVDVTVSAVVLALASPVLAVATAAVRLTLGRPVLFRQPRPGLHGRTFVLYKIRTMREATDEAGRPLADHQRVNAVGRLLRRLSVDELPQLWNVLRGDMSLVGPRPLLVEYLALYTPEQARRHSVRPGVTGLAQVHGRDHLPWEERFRLDVHYADHRTLGLDLRIAAATFRRLVDWREMDGDVAPFTQTRAPATERPTAPQ
jgi:lipopolysaccharide/colanic/teichoic acid biosynthesis glycosyltransferase